MTIGNREPSISHGIVLFASYSQVDKVSKKWKQMNNLYPIDIILPFKFNFFYCKWRDGMRNRRNDEEIFLVSYMGKIFNNFWIFCGKGLLFYNEDKWQKNIAYYDA